MFQIVALIPLTAEIAFVANYCFVGKTITRYTAKVYYLNIVTAIMMEASFSEEMIGRGTVQTRDHHVHTSRLYTPSHFRLLRSRFGKGDENWNIRCK